MLEHEIRVCDIVHEVEAETQSGMYRKRHRDGGQQYSYCARKHSTAVARLQGGYTRRRAVEVTSMDTRTTYNIPMPTLAGGVVDDSPPSSSNTADGTRLSADSARWPCASDVLTLLRGNP